MYAEPNLAIDQETSIVATYMKRKFPGVLLERSINTPDRPDFIGHPKHWSLEFSLEVDLALDIIARAFNNSGDIAFHDLTQQRNLIPIFSFN